MSINRRAAIKQAAYLMGGAVSAPTILGIMQGCAPDAKPAWTPSFFTNEQALAVQEVAEAIIPATDTLGAKDLGVPKFIEGMVGTIYKKEDRDRFMTGLSEFQQDIDGKFGKPFNELTKDEKDAVVKELNDYITNPENRSSWAGETPFFWAMKELTLIGYFTTEYGATTILQYQLVPAYYEPCVPVEEAGEGRAYAV